MSITVYGNLETCGKCRMVHKILEDKSINFEFIDDEEVVIEVAKKLGFMGIPFAIVDNLPMDSLHIRKYVEKL